MSWLPSWSSIIAAAVVIAAGQYWRIHRKYPDHRFKRFIGWRFDDQGRTDDRWGWLYRHRTRRVLAVANPVSWVLTLYGATDLPAEPGLHRQCPVAVGTVAHSVVVRHSALGATGGRRPR